MFCTFGELIKEIRKRNNLTLLEMSKILEIDNSLLGKIENNSRNPTIELIEMVSKKFNFDYKKLIIASQSDKLIELLNKNSIDLKRKIIESFLYKLENEVKRTRK